MSKLQAHPDFPSWAQTMGTMDFDMSMDSVYNWGDPVIGVNRTYMSDNIAKGRLVQHPRVFQSTRG